MLPASRRAEAMWLKASLYRIPAGMYGIADNTK